ncbi:MAG TPA: M1 family metallopeptidase, partial [Puia sp.]|nr:M1 family metallopeptidase [Puia sp.]
MNLPRKIVLILLLTSFTSRLTTRAQTPSILAEPGPQLTIQNLKFKITPYWQQRVDYTIDVSLNDADRSLDGFIRMFYTNHSPDTLSFIWIHCWPNAYKNDRTAFSDQLLANGQTDFYFSEKEQKGYINHLDFRVDGAVAKMEDHPEYIDIVRILLPHPLPPEGKITITTPFHVKLPFNFSRGGYVGNTFQVTQWYPKPAVYDSKGWHPIPYLDQGEFYSEFGDFDVRITVPQSFVVAATGELQNAPGRQEYPSSSPSEVSSSAAQLAPSAGPASGKPHKPPFSPVAPQQKNKVPSENSGGVVMSAGHQTPGSAGQQPASQPTKTLQYRQSNIHDFAWFANKDFRVDHDTLQLASGRIIDVYSFYMPSERRNWQYSVRYIKDAVLFRSALIGEYPFNVVTAADISMGSSGGMEYPTITGINTHGSARELDITIEHEVGHNWFYAILGTNERRYPWMDEGINTYYDNRYEALRYPPSSAAMLVNTPGTSNQPKKGNNDWLLVKTPADDYTLLINTLAKEKRDQPISTSSEDFTDDNYDLIAYKKAGLWMRQLEDSLGTSLFDSCMHQYFVTWQFRHPYPEDFRAVMENTSHRDLH